MKRAVILIALAFSGCENVTPEQIDAGMRAVSSGIDDYQRLRYPPPPVVQPVVAPAPYPIYSPYGS